MPKIQIITKNEIEHDIIMGMQESGRMSKKVYKRMSVLGAFIGIGLGLFTAFRPATGLLIFLGMFIASVVEKIVESLIRRHKINCVCMDHYKIVYETLSHVEHENYKERKGRRRVEWVDNYTLFFENGKSYRIPKENYTWSDGHPLFDHYIYEHANRGDQYILAIEKSTGKIAAVYHTGFFAYRAEL